ncbi:MAG: M24 family metallopeptidase [Chloroflexia bacterium]
MGATIERIAPGDTEHEIAAALRANPRRVASRRSSRSWRRTSGYADFSSPPTDKRLDRYAMVVLCGRRQGLVSSITRLVHFGPMPDELRRKQRAVARVDAAFIGATRPGARLSEVFARAVQEYADVGFPDEWRRHHQGGPAGYEPREYLGTPTSEVKSSRRGPGLRLESVGRRYKSEDTILVGQGLEVLTTMTAGRWS